MARTARSRSGGTRPGIDPTKSVYINCPYDEGFADRFDAIVFATVACGFSPRSALESGTGADPRMERITKAIFSSKYSIHDLSRCKGEGDESLARFNMPLELGIAMARRFMQGRKAVRHDWMVLVPAGDYSERFLSNLNGFDLSRYDGTVMGLVQRVVFWLRTRPDAVSTPMPDVVLAALGDFSDERKKLKQVWGDEVPWADLILAARRLVPG